MVNLNNNNNKSFKYLLGSEFENISWDDALTEIKDKIKLLFNVTDYEIKESDGIEIDVGEDMQDLFLENDDTTILKLFVSSVSYFEYVFKYVFYDVFCV